MRTFSSFCFKITRRNFQACSGEPVCVGRVFLSRKRSTKTKQIKKTEQQQTRSVHIFHIFIYIFHLYIINTVLYIPPTFPNSPPSTHLQQQPKKIPFFW